MSFFTSTTADETKQLTDLRRQENTLQAQLNHVHSQIDTIKRNIRYREECAHRKREGTAVVSSYGWVGGIGLVLCISSTTVPIRVGDVFRVGTYAQTFQVKRIKTHSDDDLELEIDPYCVGWGQIVIKPTVDKPMTITAGDIITKITLEPLN